MRASKKMRQWAEEARKSIEGSDNPYALGQVDCFRECAKVAEDFETSLLTDEEHECLEALAKAANLGFKIIKMGGVLSRQQTRTSCDGHDADEWAHHIHLCQQTILAQAAARAFPERYRLLGGAHAVD